MLSRIIKRLYIENKELKYLAYYDSLTGIYNRNWLHKNIYNIKSKYVYFIDINDLRIVNKNGHWFGDEYINRIVKSIYHNGILVRYGGDEFILFSNERDIIKTNMDYSVGCSKVGDSIQNAINNANMNMITSKAKHKKKHM